MCVSAEVSFGMASLLAAGGIFSVYKASKTDMRYVPLALFPIFVAVQQMLEGFVWIGVESSVFYLRMAALGYLFFAWIVWPSFVPYMTAKLEEEPRRKKILLNFAQAGFLLGLILYLPNFWHPEWLNVEIINRSIAYKCTLITDNIMPKTVTYLFYLSMIGLPPLLSSHRALNIFGAGLIAAVPLTYFFFSYAHVSVLCFFAALMTLYIIYVILEDKCEARSFMALSKT
ncbi:MAG TPA: hypothetical protein DEA55_10010 [Rhodospirillaceae bacterium]|nr:hypothetical protein [Rhodospirillaceae bacterium]